MVQIILVYLILIYALDTSTNINPHTPLFDSRNLHIVYFYLSILKIKMYRIFYAIVVFSGGAYNIEKGLGG